MGKILLYGFDVFVERSIKDIAGKAGMNARRVSPDEVDTRIMALMASDCQEQIEYGRNDDIPEMIVMAPESRQQMDAFLDELRKAQIKVPYKAVVTPTNAMWTLRQLAREIVEEHRRMTGKDA